MSHQSRLDQLVIHARTYIQRVLGILSTHVAVNVWYRQTNLVMGTWLLCICIQLNNP